MIERFSLHDGPGIRSLVIMKGCPDFDTKLMETDKNLNNFDGASLGNSKTC